VNIKTALVDASLTVAECAVIGSMHLIPLNIILAISGIQATASTPQYPKFSIAVFAAQTVALTLANSYILLREASKREPAFELMRKAAVTFAIVLVVGAGVTNFI
jgi:hypothetical protein